VAQSSREQGNGPVAGIKNRLRGFLWVVSSVSMPKALPQGSSQTSG